MKNLITTLIVFPFLLISCSTNKSVEKIEQDKLNMNQSAISKDETNKMGVYTVKNGDTLMLISFKLYGDYSLWREILAENPEIDENKLITGKELTYQIPENSFVWIQTGSPYLIQEGDTLGFISRKLYDTPKKWESLWGNNNKMIKDPNLIFAGFTLYYVDFDELAKSR